MSLRQAVVASNTAAPAKMRTLLFNFSHLFGVEIQKECFGLLEIELGIRGFDAQKEPIDGCVRSEPGDVEYRMIWHGQLVHREHPNHGTQRGQQHGAFKGYRNESGPTVEWPPADVVWIGDHANPPQQHESANTTCQAADQHHERYPIPFE